MNDRALSDLVGYILIFSLIMIATTTIFMVGMSHLDDTRESERVNNAEVAFDVLSGNLEDHIYQNAVGRSTEIRLADAELYVGDHDEIYVNVTDGGGLDEVYYESTRPITYESAGGTSVIYSNGGVFRENADYSRMLNEPNFIIDREKAVIQVVEISGSDRISASNSRVVQVRTEQRSPSYYHQTATDNYEIQIQIITNERRADAWEGYLKSHADGFENPGDFDCGTESIEGSDNVEVTCDFDTDEIYITVTRLSTELN